MLFTLLLTFSMIQAPPPELPRIVLDRYGAESRTQIETAYEEAKRSPQDATKVGRLGMLLQSYEEFEAAEKCYRRARVIDRSGRWIYLLGVVEATLGRHPDAIVTLRESLAVSPDNWQARLRLADSLFAAGDLIAARREYEELTKSHPETSLVHYGLGRLLASQRDFVAAVRSLQRAVDLSPYFGAAHYALAMACRETGETERSTMHLRDYRQYQLIRPVVADPILIEVGSLNRGATSHLRKGVELESAGDLPGAIAEHEKALAINSQFEQVRLNLLTLYAKNGQIEKAEQQYKMLQEVNPNLAESHYNYGVMLATVNRFEEATSAFRRCLSINPDYGQAHYNLGRLREMAGDYDEALKEYRLSTATQPSDRESHFQLARMLIYKGSLGEAIEALKRTIFPEDEQAPKYTYALGATYARAGDRENGLRFMHRARDLASARGQIDLLKSIERDILILEK